MDIRTLIDHYPRRQRRRVQRRHQQALRERDEHARVAKYLAERAEALRLAEEIANGPRADAPAD